jgi:hypothetical protein
MKPEVKSALATGTVAVGAGAVFSLLAVNPAYWFVVGFAAYRAGAAAYRRTAAKKQMPATKNDDELFI